MTASSTESRRFAMTVAYDGSGYSGWQIQPGNVTVQEKLEAALLRFSGRDQRIVVHGSGRTDQGVHARGQVAHFDLPARIRISPSDLVRPLNALLPRDIRVMRIRQVNPEFHARKSARGKEYRYMIWDGEIVPPFLRLYRTHVPGGLDVGAMRKAARHLAGKHDFVAFTANPKREVGSTVRDMRKLSVSRRGHEVTIAAEANGFLYKMVRSLAGFLIRVGQGDVTPDEASRILHSLERTQLVPTAPPEGLFLWRVMYESPRRGES